MSLGGVHGVRRGVGDVRADGDERRPLRFRPRRAERPRESVQVLRIGYALHVPALGLHPRRMVLAVEGDRGRSVDRDVVVVVADDQLAQPEVAGDRHGLVRDPLHQVTVGADHVGAMVDDLQARAIEVLGQESLGHRHANRVADALPERTCRYLDAGRVTSLGMAGCARTPLAKAGEVLESQVEAAEVQQRVLQHACVSRAEDEAVAVGPGRVLGIDLQELLEQRVAERS